MQFVGYMSPTGPQASPPQSGPRGVAVVNIDVSHSVIDSNVQWTDTGTPIQGDPNGPCPEAWPSNGIRLYVVAGDKITASRALPPGTCSTTTDDWAAGPQIVQAIVANPSNAIVYVQAPPGSPGSPESLPGGVVLNPGSPWARLQAAPPPSGGVNA